jgi:hypothetical protein
VGLERDRDIHFRVFKLIIASPINYLAVK